jgi:hypothetical protein
MASKKKKDTELQDGVPKKEVTTEPKPVKENFFKKYDSVATWLTLFIAIIISAPTVWFLVFREPVMWYDGRNITPSGDLDKYMLEKCKSIAPGDSLDLTQEEISKHYHSSYMGIAKAKVIKDSPEICRPYIEYLAYSQNLQESLRVSDSVTVCVTNHTNNITTCG